jgi:WD40 repeat protein
MQAVLDDLEAVQKQKIDSDILLVSSLIKKCYITLTQDPLRIASEILARLRPLQGSFFFFLKNSKSCQFFFIKFRNLDEYGEHVISLVDQTMEWCSHHESPVLVPLSAWLESPETLAVTKLTHTDVIRKIAVTSYNQHVFFSTPKNDIVMYHIPSKKFRVKFTGHTDTINSLQITYDNRYLISAAADKLVKVWNLSTGEEENTYTMHKGAILCTVLTRNNEHLITGTYDRLINVISIETGEVVHSVLKHFDAVTALAISQDDSILISGRPSFMTFKIQYRVSNL